jgi:serine/threonine protein kinase/FMN phosphatase YigB (HAD superfamily)
MPEIKGIYPKKDKDLPSDHPYADEKSAIRTIDKIFDELVVRYPFSKNIVDRTDVARFVLAVHEKIEEIHNNIETFLAPVQQTSPIHHLGTKVEEMLLHKALDKADLFKLADIERMVRTQTGSINGLTAIFDEPLSTGSSGILYRAQDPEGKDVVMKVLGVTSEDVDPSELKGRLWREVVAACMASLLKEPHFIKARGEVFNFDPEVGFYLVLENVRGYPLVNLLNQYRDKPPRKRKQFLKVLIMARQIGEALHCLHTYGFHRLHLNPENVIVDAKGRITLTGFGSIKRETGTAYTKAGILSLPAYTSPEELRWGAKKGGAKSDLWVLGVLLYELVAGESPFMPGQTVMDMLRMSIEDIKAPILKRSTEPLYQVNPSIKSALKPEELHTLEIILKSLLDDDPERRLSAEDFLTALGKAFPEVKGYTTGDVKFPEDMKWKVVDGVLEELNKIYTSSTSIQIIRSDGVKVVDEGRGWSVHGKVSSSEPKVSIEVSVLGDVGRNTNKELDSLFHWMKLCMKRALEWIQMGKKGLIGLPHLPGLESLSTKEEEIPVFSKVLGILQKEILTRKEKEPEVKVEEKVLLPTILSFELDTVLDALDEAEDILRRDSRFKDAAGEMSVILSSILRGYMKTADTRGKSQKDFLREQLRRLVQFVARPEHSFTPVIKEHLVIALQEALEKTLKLQRYALNPFQGLFFDSRGVLFHENRLKTGTEFASILRQKGREPLQLYMDIVRHDDFRKAERGELEMEEVWKQVLRRYDLPQTSELVTQLQSAFLSSHTLDHPALELARNFKERGYKIWFLADHTEEVSEHLQKLLEKAGFGELPDGKIYSHEIGIRMSEDAVKVKSHIEKHGISPDQFLFIDEMVGDQPESSRKNPVAFLFNISKGLTLTDRSMYRKSGVIEDTRIVRAKTD